MIGSTLPLLIAVGMWWTYFDRTAERAQERLRVHDDPVLAAADGYSYMHLIIVAGIIIFAGGVKLVVHNSVSAPMPDAGRLALCGGRRSTSSGWPPSACGSWASAPTAGCSWRSPCWSSSPPGAGCRRG